MIQSSKSLLDRVTRWVAVMGFTALVLIGVLTMTDAILRHLNLPRIPGFGDVGEVAFAIVVACCFPAVLMHNQNISITFLGAALGKRANAILNAFAAIITFGVFALIAWQFFEMTAELQANGRVTSTIEMPVAPWWWITTFVFVLTVPVQAWVTLVRIIEAATGKEILDDGPLAETDAAIEADLADRGRE